jgi:Domain of unknown function (DUF5076)
MIEELEAPDISENTRAMELIRVWLIDGRPTCVITPNLWEDPSAWGLLLVDVMRHLGKAYSIEGHSREAIIARIKHVFDIEYNNPTSEVRECSSE